MLIVVNSVSNLAREETPIRMGNNCKGICVSGTDPIVDNAQAEDSARGQIVKNPIHIVTENRKSGGPMGPHSGAQGTAHNTIATNTGVDSSKKISILEDGVVLVAYLRRLG